ncbi:MAG: RDD family protein [Burkholderiaceae bacterium]
MESTDVEYGGFWVRVGASLIDSVLVFAIIFPILVSIYGWTYFESASGFIAGPVDFLLSWVFPAVAAMVFWHYRQATPGKMVLGLRVVDADTGHTLSIGQSIGRYLGYYVSMIPLCLGFIWIAFDRRKQGWHDKLAGTVVIRSKNRGAQPVRFERR